MSLPKRPLGQTGMQITRVGLGAFVPDAGGYPLGWSLDREDIVLQRLRAAIDLGINWVDTGGVYAFGQSEKIVGRLLKSLPEADRPYVFTKGAVGLGARDDKMGLVSDLRPEVIRSQCHDSLRRLGVERLDLFSFVRPDDRGVPVEESQGEIERLIDEGKVRAGGLARYPVRLVDDCRRTGHVGAVFDTMSLTRRLPVGDLVPYCARHEIPFIAWGVLDGGRLVEAPLHTVFTDLDDDHPRQPYRQQQIRFANGRDQVYKVLGWVARRHATTRAAVAGAWVLAWPGVTAIVAGPRVTSQLGSWTDATLLELTDQDLDDLGTALRLARVGSGPISPTRAASMPAAK